MCIRDRPEPTAAPSSTPAATPVPTPTAAPSPTPLPELKPVLDFSKDKDGTMLSTHNTARYAYEQGALPQFLFENEKAVCDDILNNPENLATNIDAVWTKVANAALIRMRTESETEYVTVSYTHLDVYKRQPLCEFLERQGYRSSHLAVELNGTVVAKEAYDRTLVRDGDTLEVVSFVGGG